MRFDDRLLTVLKQPTRDRHDVAVRWRQLVDLAARAGTSSENPTVVEAIEAVREGSVGVDEQLRAAAARAVAALPLPIGLLEVFVADKLSVSAPVLAAATLDQDDWRRLLSIADEETQRFIATLHPYLSSIRLPEPSEAPVEVTPPEISPVEGGPVESQPDERGPDESKRVESKRVEPSLPPKSERDEARKEADPRIDVGFGKDAGPERDSRPGKEADAERVTQLSPESAAPSLRDVVARIERRRRPGSPTQSGTRELPVPSSSMFRWECGPSGDIYWVDGAPRGALIGQSIARPATRPDDGAGAEISRAFTMRAPFRDSSWRIGGEGAVAGEWKVSGVPAFEPVDGRFAGYRGVALRTHAVPSIIGTGMTELPDPDSLRELVHEIKTPLNAIIGFAEIIDGQFLGPADRRYRERASGIVVEARLLLAAIDDLDFAARLHASGKSGAETASLGDLMDRQMDSLRDYAVQRGAEIEGSRSMRDLTVHLAPELADRVIFKMCTAIIDLARKGERLRLSAEKVAGHPQVAISRPESVKGQSEAQLFGAQQENERDFANVFALRLARGLAQIAGVNVHATRSAIVLQFAKG